jgi:hypothetical protein
LCKDKQIRERGDAIGKTPLNALMVGKNKVGYWIKNGPVTETSAAVQIKRRFNAQLYICRSYSDKLGIST